MKKKFYYILIAFFSLFLVSSPITEVQGQTVFQRFSKRYLKKNKLKRLGKKLSRTGPTPLEEMTIYSYYDVVGFEPSWMIEKGLFEDHYFNLLSTLVVGEYDINPLTGACRNPENFKIHLTKKMSERETKTNMNIVEMANQQNPKIKILLQLTYYGDFGRESFQRQYTNDLLTNPDVQQSLKDSLGNYLKTLKEEYAINYDRSGILIDFEMEESFYNTDFIDFVSYLRERLDENALIYLKIPAKYKRKGATIDPMIISELEPLVDKFIIKGYGFEKYAREKPDPLVIMDSTTLYSIDGTLYEYSENIPEFSDILREKFIVEVPYFGVAYKQDQRGNYSLKEGNPYITIDNFNKDVRGNLGALKYEDNKRTAYFETNESLVYMIEDSTSLVNKFNYLTDTLGQWGFAINALGYYSKGLNRRHEMWGGIGDNFGKQGEKLGWVIAYYLTAFIPLGFVFSILKYWEVRNALAKFDKYWTRFRIFFMISIILFLICTGIIPRFALVILGLLIMAVFFVYILIKKALMRSKKYVNIVK